MNDLLTNARIYMHEIIQKIEKAEKEITIVSWILELNNTSKNTLIKNFTNTLLKKHTQGIKLIIFQSWQPAQSAARRINDRTIQFCKEHNIKIYTSQYLHTQHAKYIMIDNILAYIFSNNIHKNGMNNQYEICIRTDEKKILQQLHEYTIFALKQNLYYTIQREIFV